MRSFVFFILTLFFLPLNGCVFASSAKNEAVTAPVVTLDGTWDFGRIHSGEKVKHEFILKNQSAKIMHIKDITTSCGCTVSSVKKKILLPAEETSIVVQFDSKGYSGRVEQHIYVATDSLDKPTFLFIIKSDVAK